MNYEPITVTNSLMSIPLSTAKLLITKYHGCIPKSRRIQKKILRRAIYKALVLGVLDNGGVVSDRIKRRYLR